MLRKVRNFVYKVGKSIWRTIKTTITEIFNNLETLVLMTFSAIGIAAMLQQLPFQYAMPLWVNSPMIIPVLATSFVLVLIRIYQWRITWQYGRSQQE